MAKKNSIHIKPENRGKFTAWAKAHGMSVQEAASHVMANKDKYSSSVVKMANFAKNFGGKHELGGTVDPNEYMIGGVIQVAGTALSMYNAAQANKLAKNQEETQKQLEAKQILENDTNFLKNYNQSGTNANYYKKGGEFNLNRRTTGNINNFKPIKDDVFEVKGPKHSQGGVKLGKAEVEGGELIRITPSGIKVLSNSAKDFGFSPANNVKKLTDLPAGNVAKEFEKNFALQEDLKPKKLSGTGKFELGGFTTADLLRLSNTNNTLPKYNLNDNIPVSFRDMKLDTSIPDKGFKLGSSNITPNVGGNSNIGGPNNNNLSPTAYGGNYSPIPYAIDNVVNLMTTAATPKIPKPVMTPLVKLNSDINVDPMIDTVKAGERDNLEFINKNISDANTATALRIKSGNAATNAINKIRADEINAENEIKNKEATANIYPNLYNTKAINDFGQQQVERKLGINQSINKIFDNFSRDLIDLGDKRRFDQRDKDRLRTQLAMDTEGSLAYVVRDTNAFDEVLLDPNFDYKNYNPALIREIAKKREKLLQQNR